MSKAGKCEWPNATCACYIEKQNKPDLYNRVWMHCESGLSNTKASMARFMIFVLSNNIEIGSIYAFSPKYPRSLVCASLRLREDQFTEFENETGGKLRKPPKISLNSESIQ